jgi:hypothetical protein
MVYLYGCTPVRSDDLADDLLPRLTEADIRMARWYSVAWRQYIYRMLGGDEETYRQAAGFHEEMQEWSQILGFTNLQELLDTIDDPCSSNDD